VGVLRVIFSIRINRSKIVWLNYSGIGAAAGVCVIGPTIVDLIFLTQIALMLSFLVFIRRVINMFGIIRLVTRQHDTT